MMKQNVWDNGEDMTNVFPVDWLLENLIQTKVCKLDQDHKKCKKEKEKLWIHYKPSLFQHIGTHSSLKGKVQKLKDRQFGRVQLFVPHKNPPATIGIITLTPFIPPLPPPPSVR
jgi:alpha-1,3-mannosylglycoprotein beta-1,4-N-acetylglucosaminyltransferase A/B